MTIQKLYVSKSALHISMVVVCVGFFLGILSTDTLAVFLSFVSLSIILILLWVPGHPPLLLLPALMQWSQVAFVPFATLWSKQSMIDASQYGGATQQAAIYGLFGVTLFSVGLRIGSRAPARSKLFLDKLMLEAKLWPRRLILLISLTAIVVGYISGLAGFGGATRQLMHQLAQIKSAGIFLMAYWCFATKRDYWLLSAVIIFDIIFGMTGFFAEFKNTVLILAIAAICARPAPRLKDLLIIIPVVSLIITTTIFWSAIKPQYRILLNQGVDAQIVTVSMESRVSYLFDRITDFDGEDFIYGLDAMISRHGYIEFLGLTLINVPENMPHEYGALTLAAIQHILVPRIIYPSKPPLPNDTDVMSHYTGLPNVWSAGTSISIGYLGELYIDFGFAGGLVASLIFGSLVGRMYSLIRDFHGAPRLVNISISVMILIPVSYFGTSYIKIIGGLFFALIVSVFVHRFAFPIIFGRLYKKLDLEGLVIRRQGQV